MGKGTILAKTRLTARIPRFFAAINNWESEAPGFEESKPKPNHGRLDERSIHTHETNPETLAWPGVRQAFRITRHRTDVRSRSTRRGERTTTESYGITSLSPTDAAPERLLKLVRRHWAVEVQHHVRDVSLMEDASRLRTGHGPHNNALCNALALALIVRKNNGMKKLASTLRAYSGNRDSIFQAILQP